MGSVMVTLKVDRNTHLHEDSDNFLPIPWSLPRPHFEHNAADAPNIDLRIVPPLTVDDLRRHRKHSPLHGSIYAHRV